ncbi:MAG: hypothetical protein GWN07_24825, partial [Actinobacteria bacterium]|nr:hypothetical protein [Actinomycetota bacterium]NIS33799.1 hypothetical protein [Actinomycetota bacterium]NIW30474.1 hypothetical protein [Actinomycetota bacterium]NIX22876.1 hypothetical protein [Actinomycetota bacterium]
LAARLRLEDRARRGGSAADSAVGRTPGGGAARVDDAHLQVEIDFTDAPKDAYALLEVTAEGEPQPEERRVEAQWPMATFDVPSGTHVLAVSAPGVTDPIVESVTLAAGLTTRKFKPW